MQYNHGMNIGIINPYFDSLSGGERYTLTLASHWSKRHSVDIFWNDQSIIKLASDRFRLDLTRLHVVPNIFQSHNFFGKLSKTSTYDLLFFLSDGSIPTSFARHNVLHFQAPFQHVPFPLWKRWRYNAVVCNSIFTKTHLDPVVGRSAEVIYPPVVTKVSGSKTKENIILSVGRFTNYFQAKKQEVLVDAFKGILKKFPDWKLVCVGGLLPSDEVFFEILKKKAITPQIILIPNGSYNILQNYYEKASIYWHAAGLGETNPTLQEHFGISTVEAMAHGCVPVVYNGGGQKEIVDDGKTGYLWNTPDELIEKTNRIILRDLDNEALRKKIIKKSKQFDVSIFTNSFDALLARITS